MRFWAVWVALLALLALLAVGFAGRSSSEAPFIPIESFLEIKRQGRIREVWMDGNILLVEMKQGHVLDGKECSKVRVVVPGGFLQESAGYRRLMDGLPLGRFNYVKRGCR